VHNTGGEMLTKSRVRMIPVLWDY